MSLLRDRPLRPSTGGFSLEACKAFVDSVMGFAMTLLVVGIDVQSDSPSSHPGIVASLMAIGHSVAVYLASFCLLGTYWVIHSAIMRYFHRVDRKLIWLTLAFLLPVTFVPFATKFKDAYRDSGIAVLLLGSVNILIGGCLVALWLYGTSHPELLHRPVDGAVRRSMLRRITVSPVVVSLVAIAASRVHVYLSTLLFLTVPLYHLSHRRIDENSPRGDLAGDESPGTGPRSS
jgi:uncharacterized membrane protein